MTKSLYVYYKGFDGKTDSKIRKLMKGYKEEGSGFAFFNEERDISFAIPNRKADSIKEKVEKAGFRVEIYGDD